MISGSFIIGHPLDIAVENEKLNPEHKYIWYKFGYLGSQERDINRKSYISIEKKLHICIK